MDEEVKEKKIERRGRPKKVVVDKVEVPISQEESSDKLEERIKALESLLEDMNITKIEDTNNYSPLSDKVIYPDAQEEQALQEKEGVEQKPVKMPEEPKKAGTFWRRIFKKNKIKKKGVVLVWLLHANTEATHNYIEVEDDGDFMVGDDKYNVNEHCMYHTKEKGIYYPTCFLPTWSMVPIGTQAWFELSQERRGHELERIILRAIKKEEAVKDDDKKKGKAWSAKTIWLIIGACVVGYFVLKFSGVLK